MHFDVILANPPFQDSQVRGRTPHKLWIEFTRAALERWLRPGGVLCQVSPASFQSPNSKVLALMRSMRTEWIDLTAGRHFPDVGSSFASYLVTSDAHDGAMTLMINELGERDVLIDERTFYLPADPSPLAMSIHHKVVFDRLDKIELEKDYVTCHNALARTSDTLSRERSDAHIYPVLHTNRQVWWSSRRQEWASMRKVMWSRSGYTIPRYDDGELGGTDMVYYVRVESREAGENLAHNMNLALMRYIYATAKWSGFGNERVFAALPMLATDRRLTDDELYAMFGLTDEEVAHVQQRVG